MSSKSPPKYVFITGASSGIGRACACHLDDSGFHVFAGVRNEGDAHSLQEVTSDRLTPLLIDVSQKDTIEAANKVLTAAIAPHGLYGLINNAGITLVGPLEFVDIDRFRKQMEVNLIGVVSVTQTLLPLIRKQKGRIINIGSISGRAALPFIGPYSASKFALEAISDSLRVELRPWDISVSVIELGNVTTPIREKALADFREDIQKLPETAHALYGPIFQFAQKHLDRKTMSPGIVARAVENVLTARNPKSRYMLGADARTIALIQKLPARFRDFIITKQLPKYGGHQRG